LADSEIEEMLRDSIEHAQDDMEARRLQEQRVEAERVIAALIAALESDGEELLSDTEREGIVKELERLVEISQSDDHIEIEQGIKSLEKHCEYYVERRMNASISKAMSGHTVEEFKDAED
jgi:molecular chaperone HscA